MANTVVIKMKCTGLKIAAGGIGQEVIELTETVDRDVTKHNASRANPAPGARPASSAKLYVDPDTVAAKQFIKDQLYVVSFLETT